MAGEQKKKAIVSDLIGSRELEEKRTKEGNSLSAVQQSVIVSERDDHDGSNYDLTIDDNRSLFDSMHS